MPEVERQVAAGYGSTAAQSHLHAATGTGSALRRTGVPAPSTERGFLPNVDLPAGLSDEALPIADMADAFHVTHRTLHFYEEKGLLFSRRVGVMRIYDPWEIRRMAVITCCREVGMPILFIQDMMQALSAAVSQQEADDVFYQAMMVRKRELVSGLSTVRRQMQQIMTVTKIDPTEALAPNNDNEGGGLSDRDLRCLELMGKGYSAPQVAQAMSISEGEARDAEALVIRKFNASNRFQAVAKAVLLGIVQ